MSVVIPAFNEEAVIERCLLAVLGQTVAAQQIIVVDNASTDGTGAIVARIQREHPDSPLVMLEQDVEQGLIPSRDAGFDAATGEVLGRIDADTVLAPNWVEQVQQAFMEPGVAAVTGPVSYYDMPLPRLGLKIDDAGRQLAMQLAAGRHSFLYGSNMAIRRSTWEQIRSTVCRDHADEMHEDIDLSLHLDEHGLRIAYLSTMVAGVSARRLDDAPDDFRYYVNRFGRTYRAHHVHWPTLMAPALTLRAMYWPLKLLRSLRPPRGPLLSLSQRGIAADRNGRTPAPPARTALPQSDAV